MVDAKEGKIRAAHEPAVKLASEAVAHIRTVALLSREESVCREYRNMLLKVRGQAKKLAFLDTFLFALAQTNMFFVIALGFWYGGKLTLEGKLSSREFFVVFVSTETCKQESSKSS